MLKQIYPTGHANHLGTGLTGNKKSSSLTQKVAEKTPGKLALIVSLFLVCLLITVFSPPVTQAPDYHYFVDQHSFMGLPNVLNVLSNIPLLVLGLTGLFMTMKQGKGIGRLANTEAYSALFFAIIMLAVGSSFYHLWPSNHTLLWDRLPMALGCMSLLSVMVGEFVANKLGKLMLYPALALGASSVLYWYHTETQGMGDLRSYLLVLAYPLLIMPIMLLFFNSPNKHQKAYWWLLGAFVVAKICQHYDQQIYDLVGVLSGHTLKHLISCLGIAMFIKHISR